MMVEEAAGKFALAADDSNPRGRESLRLAMVQWAHMLVEDLTPSLRSKCSEVLYRGKQCLNRAFAATMKGNPVTLREIQAIFASSGRGRQKEEGLCDVRMSGASTRVEEVSDAMWEVCLRAVADLQRKFEGRAAISNDETLRGNLIPFGKELLEAAVRVLLRPMRQIVVEYLEFQCKLRDGRLSIWKGFEGQLKTWRTTTLRDIHKWCVDGCCMSDVATG